MNNKSKFDLKIIVDYIRKIPESIWFFGIGIITYGLLIPRLGFYLDDWYIVLHQRYFGAGSFVDFFKGDRPFFAYIYNVFVPIFKDSSIAWQGFAVLTHVFSAVVFWYLLEVLNPKQKRFNFVAGLFFLVYPGFKFHWFAVMYSQVFFLYAVYFFSFLLMVKAVNAQKGRFWFTFGALVCLIVGIVPQESFIGLEFVRPVVLYITVRNMSVNTHKKTVGTTLWLWLPYLFLFLGFVGYRVIFTSSFGYEVSILETMKSDAGGTIITLLNWLVTGAAQGIVAAWTNFVTLFEPNLFSEQTILRIIIIAISSCLALLMIKIKQNEAEPHPYFRGAILIGIYSSLVSLLPFLVGGFEVKLDFPNNRYLIAVAPGAAIFLAGLIEYLLRTECQKVFTSAILVGVAVTMQFTTARTFQLNWEYQQDFFWQLYWRAPGIEENTLLVTEDLPFSKYSSGTSLTAPLNLVYAPNNSSTTIPYAIIFLAQQDEVISSFLPGLPIDYHLRSFEFEGNTSKILLFKKPSKGCLRILTSQDTVDEIGTTQDRNKIWHEALEWADVDEVIPNPVELRDVPEQFFGRENTNQWCYFYEKAELAAQQQNWQDVVSFYNAGFERGFKPLNQFEWLPLINAQFATGSLDQVLETTKGIPDFNFEANDAFCNLWATIDDTNTNLSTIQSLNQITQCD